MGVLERQQPDLLKILEVLGVGERIAALDEIDSQLIERWVMRSLSCKEKFTPSPWLPSRNVVS